MAPTDQKTLNSFFAKPNGAKPPKPQQSKLAFSSKASGALKDASQVDDDDDDDVKVGAKKQVKKEDSEDEDATSQNGSVQSEKESPKSGRKRSSEVENQDNLSEDEPPTKKQRTKIGDKNGHQKSTASRQDITKEKNLGSSKSAKTQKTKIEPAMTTKSEVKKEVDEDDDEAPRIAKQDINDSERDSEEAEEREEAEESADEEEPEAANKKREKVQSKLTSSTKDPFPDWNAGDPVPYAALCTTFSLIEMTTKRLEISAHCSLFLRQVLRLTPDELYVTVLLMVNKLAADYSGIELGIGESLIMKAIGESTGRALNIIKSHQKEVGDLGLVAAMSKSKQPTMGKPKPLTIKGVHKGLMTIATISGNGAQNRKVAEIKKLLSAADSDLASKKIDITKNKGGPSEAKYIVRFLEGKMRLGLAEKTVLVALAHAMIFHELSQKGNKVPNADQLAKAEHELKSVYNELPSYEVIIPAMLKHGIMKLHNSCKLQPGVPLKPMLAKPTKSITEVLDRFEGKHFTCEYKYDGERAQIHFVAHDSEEDYVSTAPAAGKTDRGISNIFSRNSEDLSKKYPDILAKLPTWVKKGTKSFVLDCETVAWDTVEKKVLPFQQLMTRKKKDVKLEDVKVKVCVFAYDILFLNGEALVNKPFRERRELMYTAFTEVEGEFHFAKYGNTSELEEIQVLLEDSVKASCEGLMVKMLDGIESNYEPSRRSQNWLKVKKDYLAGIGDSLDLVVLGAYFGKGKRTSVYGAFLLACYNPNKEVYETVCNIGTGFSEAVLEQLHTQLEEIVIERPKPFYSHSQTPKDQPDVWFEPRYVWEVKTADLTLSPRYRAAAEEMDSSAGGKGVSLRFPRFLKIRDDKKPEEATAARQVAEMYKKQEGVSKTKGTSVDDDFDY